MKPTNFSISHSVAVYVLVVMIVLGGLVSYLSLPREAAPDITIPVVIVSTPYYGVAPKDIEALVTTPIERELKDLKDVKDMTSSSSEGVSVITVQFQPNVDLDEAVQKMREKVDKAKPELPADAEDPILGEINFSELPIMQVNIFGSADQVILKEIGEELKDRFEDIEGVLSVNLAGGLEREVRVVADPEKLEYFNVSLNEIIGTLQQENINLPGGAVDVGELSYLVRIDGEFKDPILIEDLVVKDKDGQPVRVRDVARVEDGFKEASTLARMNGQTNVSLSIQKRAGENLIRITDEAKSILAEAEKGFPVGVHATITADQSDQIREQVADLENNILTGLILVVGVLFFFMGGVRNSLFVAVAIPLSMLISFAVLSAMGITLNMVVLFSLVLALGMLVDNAIVIVENIYRHASMGKDRSQAARDAVAEVGWPVISSTATTVAAFGPMLFWPGIMGEFMGYLPLTVIIVLLSSLFVALIINPVICSTLMKVDPNVKLGDDSVPDNTLYRTYRRLLEMSLRWRWGVVVVSVVSLVGTFAIFGAFNAGVEFFPETTPDRAFVMVKGPDGTRLERTNEVVSPLEGALVQMKNVKNNVTEIGVSGGGNDFMSGGASEKSARITVDFHKGDDRVEDPQKTLDKIRAKIDTIAGADFEIQKESSGPPAGKPINIEILGDDVYVLGEVARQIRAEIKDIPGIVDLKDDFIQGRPEIQVDVNRRQAALSGVSTSAIANTVRSAINGVTATKLRDGEDEIDIVVRLDVQHRKNIEDIEGLTISGREGAQIPLRELATLRLQGGTGSIRHIDRQRVVTVQSNLLEGYLPNDVLKQVQEKLNSYKMPEGYTIRYTGENKDQEEAAAFLGKALLLALFLIMLVLVTQFNSVLQPLVIAASIFLSLIGVLWGLLLTNTPFGIIMVGIGIISLAGVVVNNSIVLIDYINQLRQEGKTRRQAVVEAGLVRLRPVMLTAITTVLGLLPMAVGVSIDFRNIKIIFGGRSVEMWGPMARSVSSGLVVATVLTLVFVPVMYTFADDFSNFLGRLWNGTPKKSNGSSNGNGGQPGVQKSKIATGLTILILGALGALSISTFPGVLQAQEAPVEVERLNLNGPNPQPLPQDPKDAIGIEDPSKNIIKPVEVRKERTLSLDDARGLIDQNNFTVRLTLERIQRSAVLQDKAWSLLLPTVSANAIYTINDEERSAAFGPGPPLVIQPKTEFRATGKVQVTLFNGRSWPLLKNAYLAGDLEKLSLKEVKVELNRAVTGAYYQLVMLQRLEEISQTSLNSRLLILQSARDRKEAGAGNQFEITRAEVEVVKARRELESARLSWLTARQALAHLLSTPADFGVVLPKVPSKPISEVAVPSLESALQSARTNRATIPLRDMQVEAAENELDSNFWKYAPILSAAFNITQQPETLITPDSTVWNIQIIASWTLYDGGLREAEITEQKSNLITAQIEREQAVQDLNNDITQAVQELQRQRMQLITTGQEIRLAELAFTQASDGYRLGAVSQMEAINAEFNLKLARMSQVQNELSFLSALEELAILSGS